MSRTKQIDYRRVTISLPAVVVDELKINTNKGNMSAFITDALREKFAKRRKEEYKSVEKFIESLRQFAIENTKHIKDKRSSLQILRDIRNGKDR